MAEKIEFDIKLESDQLEWLESKVKEYDLESVSKALRILLDYNILESNEEEIFSEENMRCRHCLLKRYNKLSIKKINTTNIKDFAKAEAIPYTSDSTDYYIKRLISFPDYSVL